MAKQRATTIAEYIQGAPPNSRAHLRRLYAILKHAAPHATETIKWGNPFFVEPRFLFAFSAHKAHLNLAPGPETLDHFRAELAAHETTKNFLQMPYDEPLPEDLIRRIAEYRVKAASERTDEGFW